MTSFPCFTFIPNQGLVFTVWFWGINKKPRRLDAMDFASLMLRSAAALMMLLCSSKCRCEEAAGFLAVRLG